MADYSYIICPCCGEEIADDNKYCPFCFFPISTDCIDPLAEVSATDITKNMPSYRDVLATSSTNPTFLNSVALCFLKCKLYDQALALFKKSAQLAPFNTDALFYQGVCLLKGKKAFLQPRPTIDNIVELLNNAINLTPKAIYYYFLAYIKCDFFERKCYTSKPTSKELMVMVRQYRLSPQEKMEFFKLIGVDKPASLD